MSKYVYNDNLKYIGNFYEEVSNEDIKKLILMQ